jgi:hypothetical protein
MVFAVVWWADASGADVSGAAALATLTAAFSLGYLAARAVTLSLRARGRAWMVTGSPA